MLKNTGYKLYDWNNKEIDINKDKGVYEDKVMYLKKGNTEYAIGVHSSKDYSYIKDMWFNFVEYGYPYYEDLSTTYPTKITSNNDYYLKKTFSIKNAPSLNNFREEFMKKVTGKGTNLVSITKSSSITGYQVKIPYIKTYQGEKQKYLTITYKYDSKTRKCIEIDWDFG